MIVRGVSMIKRITILLILCVFLSGCWNRRELNELAITMALGIDKDDDGFLVSAQAVVPTEVSMNAGKGGSPVTLFQAKGETVHEAIRKMTKKSSRKIYPGHLRMLVLSEELAEDGIGKPLDIISRDWEMRADFYVVIAEDITAHEVLNIQTPLEAIPASKMFHTLRVAEKNWASTTGITLDELIVDIESMGKEAVVTGIQVHGKAKDGASKQNVETITPSTELIYDNLSVFKKDKLVGWLTEDESKAYNGITNKVKNTVSTISCPTDGKADIEVLRYDTDVKGNVINGSPEVNLDIKIEANISALECQFDINKIESIDILEKIFEKEIKETVNNTIEVVQEKYESDIFGFGNSIHRSNPKEWEKLKENWDEEFSEMEVKTRVSVKIRNIGTETDSIQKMEEK